MASARRGRPQANPAPEDPADFMGTLKEIAYTMREQAAIVHHMIDQMGRQPKEGHEGNQIGQGSI